MTPLHPPLAFHIANLILIFVIWHGYHAEAQVATPQASDDLSQLTANELISAAQQAYDNSQWSQAELFFQSFIDNYGSAPEAFDTARKAKPLLVISKLRQKKYEDSIELLEDSLKDPQLDPVVLDELAFWRGVCYLQIEEYDSAILALENYHQGKLPHVTKLPAAIRGIQQSRAIEAILLQGMSYVLKGESSSAAAFFFAKMEYLRSTNREAAGRATVLLLHCLLETEQTDQALSVAKDGFLRLDEISQMVAFQTLSMQLGSKLLEEERYYDAILCLQRIWPKHRLLQHQNSSVAQFKNRLQHLRRSSTHSYLAFQYEALISRIQREITQFEAIPNFDAAVRFRLATAYQSLQRYREAALILEDMLLHMQEDDLVRTASLNVIQCWLLAERWQKAIETADIYIEKFNRADNPDLPTVYYLRATALHSAKNPYDAELAFAAVHQKFPEHPLASRALFMEGICLLEQDLNREAIDAFNESLQRYPESDSVEDAFYWIGMGLSFNKQHEAAREHLQSYLERFPAPSSYTSEATFRIAHATLSLAEYPEAITQLQNYIRQHPGSNDHEEAKLLLGDALAAEGRIEPAIAAYLSLDPDINRKFYEEAQFRIGNIYKLGEQFEPLRNHFERFITKYPDSPRIAEAVYWIGWSHTSEGHQDHAQQVYLKTIEKFGNDPHAKGIEDILASLPKLYRDDSDPDSYHRELNDLLPPPSVNQEAEDPHSTLRLRIAWAKSLFLNKTNPEQANQVLIDAKKYLKSHLHSPRIIADIADAFYAFDLKEQAHQLYSELRKWHPRAMEKDRAFFGLGVIALEQNLPQKALQFFQRFEQETIDSPLLNQVFQHKAKLYFHQKDYSSAQMEYEKILELPVAPRVDKARALLEIGKLLVHQKQDLKATAFFERVYLSYSNYPVETAEAYWQRAQALERLQHADKALEVYRELATHSALSNQPQQQQAIHLLDQRQPQWRENLESNADPLKESVSL